MKRHLDYFLAGIKSPPVVLFAVILVLIFPATYFLVWFSSVFGDMPAIVMLFSVAVVGFSYLMGRIGS